MKLVIRLGLLILSFSLLFAVKAQQKPSFHLLRSIRVGGASSWDYITVDPDNHRIYVSNGTRVVVLNEQSGDSVSAIPANGVHGIALVNSISKGYISNGRSNSCSVFDLKTNKLTGEIKTGDNPDAIFYDEFSKKIFTCNGRSKDATVIDPFTDKVIATIPLGGKPETAVSNGKGLIFVNIEDTNEVVQIAVSTLKVEKRWKLDQGEEPTGLVLDRTTNRLFVGCGNKLMLVLDAANGKTLAKLPIGDGCDGIAFDPSRKLIFASNGGDGTMTVVHESSASKFEIIQTVKTETRARTITADPMNHHVFLPSGQAPGTFHILEIGEN